MGLRAKFNLVILAAFSVGFLVAAIVLYRVADNNARNQVLQNARIMMSAADAIRNYTSADLIPLLPMETRAGKFVPETVPAFAAQTNLKQLQSDFPGFAYREAALNPTNLADRAYAWEADIIRTFRERSDLHEIVTERDTPSGRLLHMARPITVRDPACLSCHSAPANAPIALLRSYGTANGFGWSLNETIGAQVLSVPMTVPLKVAHDAYVVSLVILVLVFSVIVGVLNLLLHYLVIAPVGRLSKIADAVSLGGENVESYIKPGDDEISALSIAFSRMRESLKHAMAMLE